MFFRKNKDKPQKKKQVVAKPKKKKANNKKLHAKMSAAAGDMKKYPLLKQLKIPQIVPSAILTDLSQIYESDDRCGVNYIDDKYYTVLAVSEEDLKSVGFAVKGDIKGRQLTGQLTAHMRKNQVVNATLPQDIQAGYIIFVPNRMTIDSLKSYGVFDDMAFHIALFPSDIDDDSFLDFRCIITDTTATLEEIESGKYADAMTYDASLNALTFISDNLTQDEPVEDLDVAADEDDTFEDFDDDEVQHDFEDEDDDILSGSYENESTESESEDSDLIEDDDDLGYGDMFGGDADDVDIDSTADDSEVSDDTIEDVQEEEAEEDENPTEILTQLDNLNLDYLNTSYVNSELLNNIIDNNKPYAFTINEDGSSLLNSAVNEFKRSFNSKLQARYDENMVKIKSYYTKRLNETLSALRQRCDIESDNSVFKSDYDKICAKRMESLDAINTIESKLRDELEAHYNDSKERYVQEIIARLRNNYDNIHRDELELALDNKIKTYETRVDAEYNQALSELKSKASKHLEKAYVNAQDKILQDTLNKYELMRDNEAELFDFAERQARDIVDKNYINEVKRQQAVSVESDFNRQIAALSDAKKDLESQLSQTKVDYEQQISKLHESAYEDKTKAVEELRSKMVEEQNRLQTVVESQRKDLETSRQTSEGVMHQQREVHNAEIKELQSKNDLAIKAVRDDAKRMRNGQVVSAGFAIVAACAVGFVIGGIVNDHSDTSSNTPQTTQQTPVQTQPIIINGATGSQQLNDSNASSSEDKKANESVSSSQPTSQAQSTSEQANATSQASSESK